jgi:hypothetical protein
MKEAPRRRITVTSSLEEISTDPLQHSLGHIFKDHAVFPPPRLFASCYSDQYESETDLTGMDKFKAM